MLATLPAIRARMSVDRTAAFFWYTLCVVPQSQPRFCQRAKELGIETYTPMSRMPPHVRKFGRQRVVAAEVRPLMPGYVFVSLSARDPRFYLFQASTAGQEAIHGALRLLRGPDGPMAVSDAVIEDMRLRELSGEFDLTARTDSGRGCVARWVRVGAWVELISGPFALYRGIIEEVMSATLVKVAVTVFGRLTPMIVPLDWVRLARSADDALLISKKKRFMKLTPSYHEGGL